MVIIFNYFLGQCVTPGMYALLGAMSSLCGTTKLTVSLTIIMFELTGSLNYVVPCMITVITSKYVGDYFMNGSFAELLIREHSFPFLNPHEEVILGTSVESHMVFLINYRLRLVLY